MLCIILCADILLLLFMKSNKLIFLFVLFGYTFLFVPIIILMINSFGDSDIPGIWTHFTLKWYKQALTDYELLNSILVSLKIAIISATILYIGNNGSN